MMGRLNHDQGQLFYSFCLDEAVPDDHLVRQIAGVLDLSWVHCELAPYYAKLGRPSIDPVLMIRMLIIGYVFAIRPEGALCRDVQVNFAYRWFCGLSIEDKIPDHSAFSRARNERFRDSDIFRSVFERVVGVCLAAGLVGGGGFAVDASLVVAGAKKERSIPGSGGRKGLEAKAARRAAKEYVATLDAAAFGAAGRRKPRFVCPAGKALATTGKLVNDGETLLYLASTGDCRTCLFKAQCCPKTPFRRIPRSIYEEARDVARALAKTEAFERSRHDRKRVEMLFAHLKRILRPGRLRLRAPLGVPFAFTLAAISQHLPRRAKTLAPPPPLAAPCVV